MYTFCEVGTELDFGTSRGALPPPLGPSRLRAFHNNYHIYETIYDKNIDGNNDKVCWIEMETVVILIISIACDKG